MPAGEEPDTDSGVLISGPRTRRGWSFCTPSIRPTRAYPVSVTTPFLTATPISFGAILASHFSSSSIFALDVLVGLMGYGDGHVRSSLGCVRLSRLSA